MQCILKDLVQTNTSWFDVSKSLEEFKINLEMEIVVMIGFWCCKHGGVDVTLTAVQLHNDNHEVSIYMADWPSCKSLIKIAHNFFHFKDCFYAKLFFDYSFVRKERIRKFK